ncbi:hypothetical protein Rhe02_92500 [Rhizocola hellebori]|uniref:Uncharacterized protein n=1 Tax=Rhizocola hellebori TaxID=1392758 RepID=A0A8J3QKP9_9ACTN|nr:DUF6114 domain-containing protein [Rhizocola hellebori]GIH11183.1 hypothetical protein Rhe02_92500 [Rhizocola hellebori]
MTVWERFRQWRQSRPFWGGLLAVLAGLEIIGSMNLELGEGTISIGQEGFPAYLIAFTLIICGPLAWFMPAQRHFYGLIATFVAIYSLIGVNLGGFIVGMLLGIIGGGLIFAWNPITVATEQADASPQAETEDSSPRHAAMVIIALALSLSVMGTPGRAQAAPCGQPAAAPSPSPTPSQGPIGELIGDIVDFFGRLLGGGRTPTPTPSPTPAPTPSPCPTPSASVSPSPGTTEKPTPSTPTAPSSPGKPGAGSPPATPAEPAKIMAEGTFVARRPGRMTGSRVTMTNLNFEGVVELPVKGAANVRVLKFSMAQSDTNDFKLRVFGDKGWDTELRSSKLTVNGGTVFFYTSRFRANLFGLIPVDYTPDNLPPPIPLPLVFFTDPDIQLVLVDSPELHAPALRINQVRAS